MVVPLPRWVLAAVLFGCIQIAAGSAAIWVDGGGAAANQTLYRVFVLIALVNTAVAVLLFLGGRHDPRALFLAAAFICGGSAFSLRPLQSLAAALPSGGAVVAALAAVRIDTLLPYFIWRFAADFPDVARYGRNLRYVSFATRTSLGVGILLLAANLVSFAVTGRLDGGSGVPPLDLLDRAGPVYWPVLLTLVVAALVESTAKLRHARIDERRRVTWLFVGIAVGLAPVVLVNLLVWLVPGFAAWVRQPDGLMKVGLVAYPPIVISPFIIAYSVLVKHALDVRLVVRKVIQYALVRYSLATLVAIPFGALVLFLYANRDRTIAEVLSGRGAILLVAAAVACAAVLISRRGMARAIDRLFFREQYDARQVLAELVRASQSTRDVPAFGEVLVGEISRALHPRSACLMLRDGGAGNFVATAGYARSLPASSALIQRLAIDGKPYPIDWERSKDPLFSLPAEEIEWLGDGGFRLLVPIVSTTGGVAGLLGLADKLSELPYSYEDREFLEAIATSAGLTIENQALRSSTGHAPNGSQEYARECRICGMIAPPDQTGCGACGGATVLSPVPYTLSGKYQIIERVGSGGMGVVYRARDLALERDVAIKTLPWISPQHAQRLRREARAMASMSHPNLALIHAVESWHGTPLLILEFLPGGVLADRLRAGRLSPREAIELGQILATVAEYIHGRGILHRDIKPSNIGFTANHQPKLLDFGVAHLLDAARPPRLKPSKPVLPRMTPGGPEPEFSDPTTTITAAGELVGTLLYLPPEALEQVAPGPGFDLWSICMVLYEAIAGTNPMNDDNPTVVVRRIAECQVPDIRQYAPEVPEGVASFFAQALARNPRLRPATASELRHRLAGIPLD